MFIYFIFLWQGRPRVPTREESAREHQHVRDVHGLRQQRSVRDVRAAARHPHGPHGAQVRAVRASSRLCGLPGPHATHILLRPQSSPTLRCPRHTGVQLFCFSSSRKMRYGR